MEILQHPSRTLRDMCACAQCRCGVFMIPALIVGECRWYHAPSLHKLVAALDLSHIKDNLGNAHVLFSQSPLP
jgi:hypothetical protein